jgi:hypothetical protein
MEAEDIVGIHYQAMASEDKVRRPSGCYGE